MPQVIQRPSNYTATGGRRPVMLEVHAVRTNSSLHDAKILITGLIYLIKADVMLNNCNLSIHRTDTRT